MRWWCQQDSSTVRTTVYNQFERFKVSPEVDLIRRNDTKFPKKGDKHVANKEHTHWFCDGEVGVTVERAQRACGEGAMRGKSAATGRGEGFHKKKL